jgi:hypothetical protein
LTVPGTESIIAGLLLSSLFFGDIAQLVRAQHS